MIKKDLYIGRRLANTMKRTKKEFSLLMPRRVSLWKRILAFVIDLMIIYIATLPLQTFLAKEIGIGDKFDINTLKELFSEGGDKFEESSSLIALVAVIMSLSALFYWSVLEYLLRQSIGKILMKIAISSQTGELKIWQVLVRNIKKATFTTSLSILLLIDVIYMFFNKNNQRLTEVLSKTEVVEA